MKTKSHIFAGWRISALHRIYEKSIKNNHSYILLFCLLHHAMKLLDYDINHNSSTAYFTIKKAPIIIIVTRYPVYSYAQSSGSQEKQLNPDLKGSNTALSSLYVLRLNTSTKHTHVRHAISIDNTHTKRLECSKQCEYNIQNSWLSWKETDTQKIQPSPSPLLPVAFYRLLCRKPPLFHHIRHN